VANQAAEKADEAVDAMLRVIPDPRIAVFVAERRATRASANALGAEIKTISDLEKEQARLYNAAVSDFRSQRIRAEDLGHLIEDKMLPQWIAERDKLANLHVVPAQEPLAKRFLEYLSLRADGWRLTAAGLRSNDRRLLEQGNAKQAAAKRLMEGTVNESKPGSARPETSR
jgi:hypothetical protein